MSEQRTKIPLNFAISRISSMTICDKDGNPESMLQTFPEFTVNIVSEEGKKYLFLSGYGTYSDDINDQESQVMFDVAAEGYPVPAAHHNEIKYNFDGETCTVALDCEFCDDDETGIS